MGNQNPQFNPPPTEPQNSGGNASQSPSLSTPSVDELKPESPLARWLIIAVLLLGALGLGGWMFWRNWSLVFPAAGEPAPADIPSVVEDTNIEPPLTSATTSIDLLIMNNWKTHRNEEYGFEFKYPALGSVTTRSYNDEISAEVILPTDEDRKDHSTREFSVDVNSISSHANNCSPLAHTDKIYRVINNIRWQYREDMIGGMQTFGQVRKYKIAHSTSCFTVTLMVSGPRYYGGERDGSGDSIGRTGATPEFNYEKEFSLLNQILATFRFIE